MAARRQSTNELDAEDRNALSDKSFAFPRLRKEPLNDASHVRNAIARFDQVRDATDAEREEAFRRIKRAAKRHGVEMTETRWQELGKPSATKKSSDKPRTTPKSSRNQPRSERSRDELYAEAKRRNIKGRSAMTKSELVHALQGR
jgi:acyl-CoA reductase-like NAD-dependent aldehyde dehydrogenase